MKKIAITGISGFVARHFIEYLYNSHVECEIFANIKVKLKSIFRLLI